MATILVIDDLPEIRTFLRVVLERAGHQVRDAAEGEEGIRLLLAEPPDLVFCDMHMPGRDGAETIREFTRRGPGVPLVAMSGRPDSLALAILLGAVAVLDKPVAPSAILRAVETYALQRA
jgi:CheY-like chemotaxis protein